MTDKKTSPGNSTEPVSPVLKYLLYMVLAVVGGSVVICALPFLTIIAVLALLLDKLPGGKPVSKKPADRAKQLKMFTDFAKNKYKNGKETTPNA